MRMKVEHLITPKQERPAEPIVIKQFIEELYKMDPELIFRGKVLLDQQKVIDLAKRHKDRCVLQVEDMEKSKG